MYRYCILLWCWFYGCLLLVQTASSFSVDLLRKRLPGVWKLTIEEYGTDNTGIRGRNLIKDELLKRSPTSQKSLSEDGYRDGSVDSKPASTSAVAQEFLVKLNDNGSFRQCDEGYEEGKWISGKWELSSNQQYCHGGNVNATAANTTSLFLALDRQYFGPPHDTLFNGSIVEAAGELSQSSDDVDMDIDDDDTENNDNATTALSASGSIAIGRFTMPKKDPSFFESPVLTNEKITGSFGLSQVLSFSRLLSETNTMDDMSQDRSLERRFGEDQSDDDDNNSLFGCFFE